MLEESNKSISISGGDDKQMESGKGGFDGQIEQSRGIGGAEFAR